MPRPFRSLAAGLALAAFAAAVIWQQTPATPEKVADRPAFWKGNLHTHSLWSDGDDYPEMIADWYKSHGYHFLALTDHNRLSEGERWADADAKSKAGVALPRYLARFGEEWVKRREIAGKPQVRLRTLADFRKQFDDPGRFLMVQGEEISHQYARAPVHINAINLREVIKPTDGGSVSETVSVNYRAAADQGRRGGGKVIAVLNHPNFGWGVRAEDMVLTDELKFFEVFNGHPSVRNYGDATHASCERIWDILLALRLGKHRLGVVYGLATDDAHGYQAFGLGKVNPGRGWIMVRSPSLGAESILKAMETGDFYATSGVTLDDFQRDAKSLRLAIRAEPGVTYRTQFIATLKDARFDSEPLLDATGKELNVTRIYSGEIGKVVAEVEGATSAYTFTGKELYVRAKVISSKPHPNPYQKGDAEMAWVQPVVP